MSNEQNLYLPQKAPNSSHHHDVAQNFKYAIYSIVSLEGSTSLTALKERVNSVEFCEGSCCLAPQSDFAGRPLKDVFDYHIKIRDTDKSIHPLYFIVAADKDYEKNGVIAVFLDVGEDRGNEVDAGRCSVDMAPSWGQNLDIGNMSWYDLKEDEELEFGSRAIDMSEIRKESSSAHPDQEQAQPQAAAIKPVRQYGAWPLVRVAVNIPFLLEPDARGKPADQRRCKVTGSYAVYENAWERVVRDHPSHCRKFPKMHRQLAIVADRDDFEGEGVALVRFDWDGNVDAHDDFSIMRLDLRCETIRRVPISQAVDELDRLCEELGLPSPF